MTTRNRQEYVLLPANRAFIAFSLITAFALNLFPWGRWPAVPDWLAITLVFWNIHQPRMAGIGLAFLFGLLMDVHDATLLGEHALAYTLLSFGGISLHRRVPWFSAAGRIVHVLALMLIVQLVSSLVHRLVVGGWPGWAPALSCLAAAAVWPAAEFILLAPQRRADERDETRPL